MQDGSGNLSDARGVLLLPRYESYKDVIRRFFKFASVLILFSLWYYCWNVNENKSVIGFIREVSSHNLTTAYWYLYMYLGILLMLPILRKLVVGMNQKDYIWFFIFAFLFNSIDSIREYNTDFKLPIFTTFVGIYLLGYYLDNFVKNQYKLFFLTGGAIAVCLVVFLVVYGYYEVQAPDFEAQRFMVYDNVFYIYLDAYLFMAVKYLWQNLDAKWSIQSNEKLLSIIRTVSGCTFGIYLMSDFIIDRLKHYFENFGIQTNLLISMVLLDITVFTIGFFATWIMEKIKKKVSRRTNS
jgi:surface polysaccharide O-acyltransferase-like enzyme